MLFCGAVKAFKLHYSLERNSIYDTFMGLYPGICFYQSLNERIEIKLKQFIRAGRYIQALISVSYARRPAVQ